MTLEPELVRQRHQLAELELLVHTAKAAMIALSAAHPAIDNEFRDEPALPLEHLADQLVDQLIQTLDALERYRVRLQHPERFPFELDDDNIF